MMSTPEDDTDRNARDMQLGIDLRARGERLIAAAEAFVRAARLVFRAIIVGGAAMLLLFATIAGILLTGLKTRDTVLDCVQPSGQCYQRGQQQTRDAVTNLDLFGAWADACADEPSIIRLPLAQRGTAVIACAAAHLPKAGN